MNRLILSGTALIVKAVQKGRVALQCRALSKAWRSYRSVAKRSTAVENLASKRNRLQRTVASFGSLVAKASPGLFEAVLDSDACATLVSIVQYYEDVPTQIVTDALIALIAISAKGSPEVILFLFDSGILRPALQLVVLGSQSPYFATAVSLIHTTMKASVATRARISAECQGMRIDLAIIVADGLMDPALQTSVWVNLKLANCIITNSNLPLSNVRPLLASIISILELDEDESGFPSRKVRAACLDCLLRFTSTTAARSPDVEKVLLELDFFRAICIRRDVESGSPWLNQEVAQPWDKQVPTVGIIRNLNRVSPELSTRLVEFGMLDVLASVLTTKNLSSATTVLQTLDQFIGFSGDEGRLAILQHDKLLKALFTEDCPLPRWYNLHRMKFLIRLIREDNRQNDILTVMSSVPLLQLFLMPYLRSKQITDIEESDGILLVMQNVPFSACLKEFREQPLNEVRDRLLHQKGFIVRKIICEPLFNEHAFYLAWLALAIGLQDPRDSAGRRTSLFGEELSHLKLREQYRIMALPNIIWAVAVATFPSFKILLAQRKVSWLPVDMWRLVLQAIW